jgi:carboxypeptidase Q
MLIKVLLLVVLITAANAEKDYTDLVIYLKTQIQNKTSPFYHAAYNRLAYISDTYGPRLWGSQTLEMVISEMATMAAKEGFDNIRLEPVKNFTKWVRGH